MKDSVMLVEVFVNDSTKHLFSQELDHHCIAILLDEDDEDFYVKPIRQGYIGSITRYPKWGATKKSITFDN